MPTSISVKDAAGVTRSIATLDAIAALIGEVAASPTSNTLLDRLKTINTTLGGTNHIGKVGSTTVRASANFSRPADTTAYVSGDLVANNTTAASVTPLSWTAARVATGSFTIRRVKLKKSGTSLTAANFRLHLYGASPASLTNGDNGAWETNDSSYLGSVDITVNRAMKDSAHGFATTEIRTALASGTTLYGLLEVRDTYTPASAETFTVELEIVQD